jgi:GntR family transcriptional regulator
LDIQIALGSSVPIYRQIMDSVCRAIADGALEPGDPLPSVRALAERLVINPNTVARAYSELQREGIVDSQRGRGFSVAERRPVLSAEERRRRLDLALETFVSEIRLLNISPSEALDTLAEKMAAEARPAVASVE